MRRHQPMTWRDSSPVGTREFTNMAIIPNTVGKLPYKLLDFDQHSVEAEDCFTRHMPKDKLDTAIRPVISASGKKVLLANDRIVSALDHDLDTAMVPGSLAAML